ncbi:16S rRNA (adenine(1518)-N(6)/adenine(1519)-N(6))-dimethyltransferase RsmA [Terracidiphilus gabretensis]|jgi:16S rRNA (adenine1518-N6/adenine1519-N6)-dimethyltransferase|uniref:16S rRNA (adenine(1518)-N(6)/adenine(1519)-N(6))- dimethyltransferase RsmA n=1 Tax=Terracidiphilus gabretensis TaxID=1577687 RepID=UPI00071BD912|nr:16S rRNA (adenine(1518)-N(6)/adenine(1519)-N(6))-dimethyltransferase RsmA [Terracidiphilus gabretensis]
MPPKSKLGQNFLRDDAAIARIGAALGNVSEQLVVEIGPGEGAITRTLIERAGHVMAIEVDHELAIALRAYLPSEKFTVIEQDVLQFDFAAAAAQAGHKLPVVGNLPYYITSPILLRLAENHASLDRAVLMVQREVADRVVAEPGSRDYGVLSVTVQMYGPVERLFTLPPGAFSPPPEVHSTVFRWRFAPRFAELGVSEKGFIQFAKQIFAQKRKTLANNLRAAGLEPAAVQTALAETEISPQARAESLGLSELARLHAYLERKQAATL